MILQYFSEVILFQLIFLLIYQFLLQRETFFNLNRAYLLLTPVIAFFIPFVSISSLRDIATESLLQDFTNKTVISLPEVFLNGNTTAIEASTTVGGAVNFNWLIILYLTGVLIALSLFIYKIWKLEEIKNSSRPLDNYDTVIYEVPNSDAAFTYFNNLFVGENISNKDREQILIHELVHLNEKHGIDLAIFEIMKIIFWFNPLVYIFQSKLAMLHEFIADQNTIKQSGKKQYFEQLLNSAFSTQSISFINQFFNHSLIKKRIVMLQKSKSSQLAKLKFLMVIPLILAMLTYVACSEDPNKSVESTNLTTGSNLEIKVGDLTNQTKAEEEEVQAAIKKMEQEKSLDEVVIKDDKKEVIYFRDKETGKTMIKVNRIDGKTSTSKINQEDLTVVPFSNIDQAPLFKGCGDQNSAEEQKQCTTTMISNFVAENFNSSVSKGLGLEGTNRIIVKFRIDETGKVVNVKARAAHEILEKEGERVIRSIPQFTPGIHNGKTVSVMYALPIAFKVSE